MCRGDGRLAPACHHLALARIRPLGYNAPMYKQFATTIHPHQTIGVISHHRPDGDAIGSTLALGLALKALGKDVHLYNEDSVPERFAFLPHADMLEPLPATYPPEMSLLICVDAGDEKRLGDRGEAFFRAAPATVNIDHHGTNTRYADLNIVEGDAAACGCVLMQIFRNLGWEITQPMATALYTAISTDTGSFQYEHPTTAQVMRMAAELIELGVDVRGVNQKLYQEIAPEAITMQRDVLNHMGFLAEGAVSYYALTEARKAELQVGLEATKDLVDYIRVIRGVKVAVIFEEVGGGRIRVSLRSKDTRVNVADIAQRFGGGGHAMASGIRARGQLAEVQQAVLDAIVESLPQD